MPPLYGHRVSDGVGWTSNTVDHGLVVNGDDVVAYCLFVERHQQTQVRCNGENDTGGPSDATTNLGMLTQYP